MTEHIPKRGDHLYVWRKVRIYQHHGIVVTKEDLLKKLTPELLPSNMEELMIVEQTRNGLDIATINKFRLESLFNYEHNIGCARYNTDPMEYYLNRSGTCYLTNRLSEDEVVENAIRIYNDKDQRDIWKTYSIVMKNCEQFAFICSTNVERVLGEQVLRYGNVVKCVFVNGTFNAVKYTIQIIRQLADEILSGMSTEAIIKSNGLGALTAFTTEALILSVRLFIYYYYEKDRAENLTRKYAISPEDYLQKMTQAGFGNLTTFGMSIAGMVMGSPLFVSSMAATVCPMLFGFIGYIAARWLTGVLAIKIRQKLFSDDTKESIEFKTPSWDDTKELVKFRIPSGDDTNESVEFKTPSWDCTKDSVAFKIPSDDNQTEKSA